MRNVNGTFNKERPIEHIVEVNIYYQEYRKRTEIDRYNKMTEVKYKLGNAMANSLQS